MKKMIKKNVDGSGVMRLLSDLSDRMSEQDKLLLLEKMKYYAEKTEETVEIKIRISVS